MANAPDLTLFHSEDLESRVNALNTAVNNIKTNNLKTASDTTNILDSTTSGVTVSTKQCKNGIVTLSLTTKKFTAAGSQTLCTIKSAYRKTSVIACSVAAASTADINKVEAYVEGNGVVTAISSGATSYGVYVHVQYSIL